MKVLKPFALALAALCALGLGIWTAMQTRDATALGLESGVLLPTPRPIEPFTLTDQDGRPFTREQLAGKWSLLFAGFTQCPDVCPTTLSLLKQLEQNLQAQKRPVSIVFLSVDPQRDTADRLQPYVRHFSPTMTGITGTTAELDRLCASLGIAYVKVPGATDADYTVDHSSALVLTDPQGRVAGYFQPPFKLETLAADLARVVPAS